MDRKLYRALLHSRSQHVHSPIFLELSMESVDYAREKNVLLVRREFWFPLHTLVYATKLLYYTALITLLVTLRGDLLRRSHRPVLRNSDAGGVIRRR